MKGPEYNKKYIKRLINVIKDMGKIKILKELM